MCLIGARPIGCALRRHPRASGPAETRSSGRRRRAAPGRGRRGGGRPQAVRLGRLDIGARPVACEGHALTSEGRDGRCPDPPAHGPRREGSAGLARRACRSGVGRCRGEDAVRSGGRGREGRLPGRRRRGDGAYAARGRGRGGGSCGSVGVGGHGDGACRVRWAWPRGRTVPVRLGVPVGSVPVRRGGSPQRECRSGPRARSPRRGDDARRLGGAAGAKGRRPSNSGRGQACVKARGQKVAVLPPSARVAAANPDGFCPGWPARGGYWRDGSRSRTKNQLMPNSTMPPSSSQAPAGRSPPRGRSAAGTPPTPWRPARAPPSGPEVRVLDRVAAQHQRRAR